MPWMTMADATQQTEWPSHVVNDPALNSTLHDSKNS